MRAEDDFEKKKKKKGHVFDVCPVKDGLVCLQMYIAHC